MKNLPVISALALVFLGAASAASAMPVGDPAPIRLAELADLSLEQLANVTVTSASRHEERAIEAPASIFVLTAEDIRRSGATSLPELLRLAPNLQVIRGDTSQYIVSARGGLSGTANKMLVLVDGRTIYTPLFSGVFYDAQVLMLEDLERVEVISGPGSTLWGTNAVNGVINIVTKPAARTQGALLAAGAGDMEKGVSARAGAPFTDGHYRVYGRYFERAAHERAGGLTAFDQAERWQAGFRADWERGGRTTTVQGDLYGAKVDNLGGARDMAGGNLLGRWRIPTGADGDVMVQAFYDRTEREHEGSFREKRDTFDVEVQRSLRRARHEMVLGAGYRASTDRTVNTPVLGFMPAERTLRFANVFAQDEFAVTPRLKATFGLRAEDNTYSGLEWLPNLRLAFSVAPDHLVWSALTRSIRAPSRIDRDLVVPGTPPYVVLNNDTFRSEIANVAEVGYRAVIARGVTASFTAFHHDFRDLRTLEPGGGALMLANGGRGRTSGVEGWGDISVARDWRLSWGFATMRSRFRLEPGRVDLGGSNFGNDPRRTAALRSLWNVTRELELDLAARYMGALPNPAIPSYTVMDARAGWRIARGLEASVLVGNVFDRKHGEAGAPEQRAVFGRTVFVKLTWSP